ncbi:MAG: hypothetical protein HZB51_05915 [Chloroflexi bacterium]|nr:hypothetical protein [Chloroflexota bacterium]
MLNLEQEQLELPHHSHFDVLECRQGELIQPPDLDAFRKWNCTQKPRKHIDRVMTEQQAVSRFVTDGCYLGTELYGTVRCPIAARGNRSG